MAPFEHLQSTSTPRIFIVGGGIVGSALAYFLSESLSDKQVVVLDKSISSLVGSTSLAPGFVGLLNASTVLTRLAKDSVAEYSSIPGGFEAVGGLELASTPEGVKTLRERLGYAKQAGLPAEIVTAEDATCLAPDFVKPAEVKRGLYFPTSGTANPGVLTAHFKERAQRNGVLFVEVAVTGLEMDNGVIAGISTSKGPLRTASDTVVLATGIWTQQILSSTTSSSPITHTPIPIIPVAHPYTYTSLRPRRQGRPYPFVRWPEHHVYARDHGNRDGLGSYSHTPTVALPTDFALGKWSTSFETVLAQAAQTCLRNSNAFITQNTPLSLSSDAGARPFNGIFAVTPDNLPFAGKAKATQNLWLCAAVWVTHAAGTARLLAREMARAERGEHVESGDAELLKALDPDRFKGADMESLTRQALERYNDIYNSEPVE